MARLSCRWLYSQTSTGRIWKYMLLWYDKPIQKNYKSHRPKSVDTYEFSENHPGFKFSHLSKIKHSTIPRIALPPNKLCSMVELELQHDNSTEKTHDIREMYAKWLFWCFTLFDNWKTWQLMEVTGDNSINNYNAILNKNTQISGKMGLKYSKT